VFKHSLGDSQRAKGRELGEVSIRRKKEGKSQNIFPAALKSRSEETDKNASHVTEKKGEKKAGSGEEVREIVIFTSKGETKKELGQ